MGQRVVAFFPDQWYHCYNRGVDRRVIFADERDYERMLMLLYVCNSTKPVHVSNFNQGYRSKTLSEVLTMSREAQFVDIGAYSLMPNHAHILLRERTEGGITSFMRKIGTAYTMYFNIRYGRTGVLFQGTFKAKHVADDQYLSRVASYIHANHAELREAQWKRGVIQDVKSLKEFLVGYRYSSLQDYSAELRPESIILDKGAIFEAVGEQPDIGALIEQARIYSNLNDEFD